MPDLAGEVHGPLERLGFTAQAETCTLYRPLADLRPDDRADVGLAPRPGGAWLALRAVLNGHDPVAARVLAGVLDTLLLPRVFVAVGVPGPSAADRVAAGAFGVLHRDLVVVEAVGTDPAFRGLGLGQRAVAAVLAWGKRQGATGACLQVVADNAVARRLYGRLGFARELYRYSYRCRAWLG